MSAGSAFQARGPATDNASVDYLFLGTIFLQLFKRVRDNRMTVI